nr:MAG TPA: hypothetical protein [Caudoviricetes sp.]DAM83897.1 MAG TPA: hypothetical protein [Caudoviricetes sp.]DAV62838.1 MAG TPA: hypothetical protein [Caudoviricetes sp.]
MRLYTAAQPVRRGEIRCVGHRGIAAGGYPVLQGDHSEKDLPAACRAH